MIPADGTPKRLLGTLALVLALAAAALSSGCATPGAKPSGNVRSLKSIPSVPTNHIRADRAILAAFFSASGLRLSVAEAETIISHTAPRGRMDRAAIRRIAREKNRVLMVVKADERFLWEELGNNLPVLLLLPPGTNYVAAMTPLLPVAWNKSTATIDLLDGNGEIQSLPEKEFFARREALRHAAICLMRPGGARGMKLTREQTLLLADFWFDRGFYRRADAAYDAVQDFPEPFTEHPPAGPAAQSDHAAQAEAAAHVAAMVGKANVLVRKGRYKEATPMYRSALMAEPDNPKILNNLAYSMVHGDDELLPALRHANKALQLDPDNPVVLETLGTINLKLGDAPLAARHLEMAWARALKHPPEVQIAIMDQLARAWLGCHREDLAWQVASFRHRTFPGYRMPPDLIQYFPALRRPPSPIGSASDKPEKTK